MSKRLNPREAAIFKHTWQISKDDVAKLDHFFLLHDTWENLKKDFYVDEQEVKRFLRHEGREYEVILMQPVRQLMAAKDLGLSFRVNSAYGLRVVLIKEWYSEVKLDERTPA